MATCMVCLEGGPPELYGGLCLCTDLVVHADCLAKLLNQNFLRMNISSTLVWSMLWSPYNAPHIDPFQGQGWGPGLAYAWQPWSGAYNVTPAVWAMAHTTQARPAPRPPHARAGRPSPVRARTCRALAAAALGRAPSQPSAGPVACHREKVAVGLRRPCGWWACVVSWPARS